MKKEYLEYEDGTRVELGPDDAPELSEAWFKKAKFGYAHLPEEAQTAIRSAIAAQKGRPKSDNPKKQVTVRLNPRVLEKLREDGKGWQTRLNAILEAHFGLENSNPSS
jgi:uncharacterized protein (DUF4415 family)